jgi:hypothetical protein
LRPIAINLQKELPNAMGVIALLIGLLSTPPMRLHRVTSHSPAASLFNQSTAISLNSKDILAATLYLTSSSTWGEFPSTGPSSDQYIEFDCYGAGSSYGIYVRFDSEDWEYVGSGYGSLIVTVFKWEFVGARIDPGSHTYDIIALDTYGSRSNTLTIAYDIIALDPYGSLSKMSPLQTTSNLS